MTVTNQSIRVLDRLDALDVLRGVAVLGILVLNIHAFASPEMGYQQPASIDVWTVWDQVVMWLTMTLGEAKFLTILSVLFGASIGLFARREGLGADVSVQHRRRMVVLAIMGLLHAYGVWYGDILFHYAVCGYLLWWLRDLRPQTMAFLAAVFLGIPALLFLLVYQSVPLWSAEQLTEIESLLRLDPNQVQQEVAAYRGGWLEQWPQRAGQAWFAHTDGFWRYILWRTLGLMLIGLLLVRAGWLDAEVIQRHRGKVLCALLLGLLLSGYGAAEIVWYAPDAVSGLLIQPLWNYFGSLLVAAGYIGLFILWATKAQQSGLRERLRAVGRLALSVYLAQSLIATTLFYGHGFGQFGYWSPVALMALVVVLTILTLMVAPCWLRHFSQGPMEWLWRRFTYRD